MIRTFYYEGMPSSPSQIGKSYQRETGGMALRAAVIIEEIGTPIYDNLVVEYSQES